MKSPTTTLRSRCDFKESSEPSAQSCPQLVNQANHSWHHAEPDEAPRADQFAWWRVDGNASDHKERKRNHKCIGVDSRCSHGESSTIATEPYVQHLGALLR